MANNLIVFSKQVSGAEGSQLTSMLWGIVSLVDLYVGFALFALWIAYRESAWWRAGRPFHRPCSGRFQPQQAVGEQVEPQKLQR